MAAVGVVAAAEEVAAVATSVVEGEEAVPVAVVTTAVVAEAVALAAGLQQRTVETSAEGPQRGCTPGISPAHVTTGE